MGCPTNRQRGRNEITVKDESDPPVVELVRSSYQPSKAEQEEEIKLPERTTPEDLARAVTRTVQVKWKPRP